MNISDTMREPRRAAETCLLQLFTDKFQKPDLTPTKSLRSDMTNNASKMHHYVSTIAESLFMMLVVIFLTGVLVSAGARTTAAQVSSDVLLYRQSLSLLNLRHGYDPETNSSFDQCVSASINPDEGDPASNTGLQQVYATTSLVETKKELVDNLSGSLSGGIAGFSATAGSVENVAISNYEVNVLITFRVERGKRLLYGAKITDDALAIASTDPQRFREICGSHYIFAEFTGGYLFALLQISTRSRMDHDTISASIGGMFNNVSFGVEQKSELRRTLESRNVQIYIFQAGGDQSPSIATNVDQFLQNVNATTTSIIDSPTVGAYSARSYKRVINFPAIDIPQLSESYLRNRQLLLDYWYYLDDLKARLSYVLIATSEFSAFDRPGAETRLIEVVSEWSLVNAKVQACVARLEQCSPHEVRDLSFAFPERIGDPLAGCRLEPNELCGVFRYNEIRSVACGVESYLKRRDPSCGVENYTLSRTADCGIELYNTGYCIRKYQNQGPVTSVLTQSIACKTKPEVKEVPNTNNVYSFSCIEVISGAPQGLFAHGVYSAQAPWGGRTDQCEHQAFGVAQYQACRHPTHGVESYNFCSSPDFGIEAFKMCSDPSHGVAVYQSCLVRTKDNGQREACSTGITDVQLSNQPE